MARGYLYHIVKDPDELGYPPVHDFSEGKYDNEFDYIQESENTETAAFFAGQLAGSGFPIGRVEHVDAWFIRPLTEDKLNECKKKWFKEKFKKFKELSEDMTLEDFALNEDKAYDMQTGILDNKYGDAIYLEMDYGYAFMTIDRFIRKEVKPDTAYYINDRVMIMH